MSTPTPPRIVRASGALVEARPLRNVGLYEQVRVGRGGLPGEVIRISGDRATIQVFEDTTGLTLGDPVEATGAPLEVMLGPGLLGSVLDGVGRPLQTIAAQLGDFILPGAHAPTLDPATRWTFTPALSAGDRVQGGDVLGTVQEGPAFLHRILVPPGVEGAIAELVAGEHAIKDPIGRLDDGTPLHLAHPWPVRIPRPAATRLPGDRPLLTGQRVFDFLFPVAEGGSVAVPGGFGTGKTVIEQSLARYSDADIVVYVGCGERGNEMAELLSELPQLHDPRTGRTLSERTVLVINTSNMAVAARESSIYLALTVGEYFRDQGLRVAVLADSLSRWAEALREIGSRLGEMPGEEGYPTTLGSRLGRVYERAGRVTTLGSPARTGSLTFIAAISPPGGDYSEPVTQASMRVAGALWALDARLAQRRQFPAVSWETSYTAYAARTAAWFSEGGRPRWGELRVEVLTLLQQERELREIAELVGVDALEEADRLLLEVARIVREVVVGQNAFDPHDAFSSLRKTYELARLALELGRVGGLRLGEGVSWEALELVGARRAMIALRDSPEGELDAAVAAVEALLGGLGVGEESHE